MKKILPLLWDYLILTGSREREFTATWQRFFSRFFLKNIH